MQQDFLDSTRKMFRYYEHLGRRTLDQLSDDQITHEPGDGSNSIEVLVRHLSGNMLSRWTDFLTSDGEKPWRDRDSEFEAPDDTRAELEERWDRGWACLFGALDALSTDDLDRTVRIRNLEHTVIEAIQRQLGHYAYHVGQIVYVGRLMRGEAWETLSVARGASKEYNAKEFARGDHRGHFSDEFVDRE